MRRNFGWLVVLAAVIPLATSQSRAAAPRRPSSSHTLTLDERVADQRAIEEVFWRHRIWPTDNAAAKPSLEAVMPESAIRAKVLDYLRKSNALATLWNRPITGEQLQAELDRMARDSHDPRVLQELFDALGNDAYRIAETLARPVLVERLARNRSASGDRLQVATRREAEQDLATALPRRDGQNVAATTSRLNPSFESWWTVEGAKQPTKVASTAYAFTLPAIGTVSCTNDTWRSTFTDVPDGRYGHTAVWTGTEMIVWGGTQFSYELNTGARYNPATDTWAPTSTGANVPLATYFHTAVWTGTEMIVWGGQHIDYITGALVWLNSGARYNPANDSWTPTSTGANVPTGRHSHAAVWTGTEMIVWGGLGGADRSGGRYNPIADSWTKTSTPPNGPFVPVPGASVVWTGTEMILWGGAASTSDGLRYNPVTDLWTPTSNGANVPSPRSGHTAVWTGTEMIVWGGQHRDDTTGGLDWFNNGARYDPANDSWTPTSTGANVPDARSPHSAVWTGSKMIVWGDGSTDATYDPSSDSWLPIANSALTLSAQTVVWTGTEMIVWGGIGHDPLYPFVIGLNTGARYNPRSDTWVATSVGSAVPDGRLAHTAIWTGSEMIVWGGQPRIMVPGKPGPNTGGRYIPAIDSWVPTSVGDGVPGSRTVHSAVWTGKEMIVWGGLGDVGEGWLTTGGRYNPMTDSWAATSTGANVPPALRGHAAVWTGREMIVRGSFNDISTGGRYDPATDSWRAMASGPAVAGYNFGSPNYLWTGTEMLVWGGCCNHTGEGRYNPTTDSWTAISTGPGAPNAQFDPSKVWTGTEMIVWGGAGLGGPGGRYNPSTDSWLPVATGANEPSARSLATAVWTGAEMIVWGGANSNSGPPAIVGGRYDPVTNNWTQTSIRPNAPSPVPAFHTAVFTGTEMIVWGGEPGTATGAGYCACPAGRLFYRDSDGDGFGDPAVSKSSCDGAAPVGYVIDHTDCNDAVGSVHPGAAEVGNGIDDDCDGLVDESASAVVLKVPGSL